MHMNLCGGLALTPTPCPAEVGRVFAGKCAVGAIHELPLHEPWKGGHPGRHAGWKPALLEPHPSEDPRNNMHHGESQ